MEEVLLVVQRMHLADWLLATTVLLLAVLIVLVIALLRKKPCLDFSPFQLRFDILENGQERLEKAVRDEIARNREESSRSSRQSREEITRAINAFGGSLQSRMAEIAGLQKDQLDSFAKQLFMLTQTNERKFEQMRTTIEEKLSSFQEETRRQLLQVRDDAALSAKELREEVGLNLKTFRDSLISNMGEMAVLLKSQLEIFAERLSRLTETNDQKLAGMRDTIEQRLGFLQAESAKKLDQMREETGASARLQREELALTIKRFTESNEAKLEAVRTTVEGRLKQIQDDNSKQLELMRATVDEKLQGTLEKRLGESFKQVSERLEQVHKGLGEMQNLASGVGDLKRALTNVKTRGGWGEIQLQALLEEILSPEQYERNVKTNELSGEIVEFAIKLPGRDDGDKEPVWLPIDAKFPIEDYQRLVDAQERADSEAADSAARMLTLRIKGCARDICDKYICPPRTTDFGIMFLPTEGLYAEVVRRSGLVESIQRECRVVIAGPTTFAALLNSLQMGFRTLAIQKRSSEVWKLLGAVKTEFGKFGDVLDGVKKKLEQATNTMDGAARRSRAIERKLRGVQELPSGEAQLLLVEGDDGPAAVE